MTIIHTLTAVLSGIWEEAEEAPNCLTTYKITNIIINLAEKYLGRENVWLMRTLCTWMRQRFNDGATTTLCNSTINHLQSLHAYRIPTSIFCCYCCRCPFLQSCMFYFLASGSSLLTSLLFLLLVLST